MAADVRGMRLSDVYLSEHNGLTHVFFTQQREGFDIWNAVINVNLAADGTVVSLGNRFLPEIAQRVTAPAIEFPAEAAIARAAVLFEEPFDESLEPAGELPADPRVVVFATNGATPEPIRAKLVYHLLDDGQLRLVWRLEIETNRTGHLWDVRVDAATGEILAADDRAQSLRPESQSIPSGAPTSLSTAATDPARTADGSSYLIFAPPVESPLHPAGVGTPQSTVAEPADPVASPFGWHDLDGAPGAELDDTRGNNVDAYADADGTGIPSSPRPDGGVSLDFAFSFDQTIEPDATAANIDASVTNLFFWVNYLHDVTYAYGFNEAAGNFQRNNYGRGGLGNDDMRAEGQDGSSNCNAGSQTPDDGLHPTIFVGLCDAVTPSRDGALDHGVVSWAYSGAMTSRLTGGPSNENCLSNSERPEAGWRDWFGLMMTQTAAHDGATGRSFGTYLLGQAADGPGVRPRLYSPDLTVNEFTYSDIKTGDGFTGVGQVWGTILWDLTLALIGDAELPDAPLGGNGSGGGSGFNPDLLVSWSSPAAGGNNLALQLVVDGLKLQPCFPGFVDARDAILLADEALTPWADMDTFTADGRNACSLWKVFSRRGLGFSASQGSPFDRTDGTEAFDMPPAPVWDLSGLTFSGAETIRGQSITASTVTVAGGGDLTLQSKTTVALADGFTLEPGGSLAVVIDPDGC
jgi:extracellular elastinolytic metalloproteinase